MAQQQNRQSDSSHANNQLKMFNAFDVRETSYHFFSQRIDLHLCDDEGGEYHKIFLEFYLILKLNLLNLRKLCQKFSIIYNPFLILLILFNLKFNFLYVTLSNPLFLNSL